MYILVMSNEQQPDWQENPHEDTLQNSDPAFAIFFQRQFMSSTDGSQEKDTYDHGSWVGDETRDRQTIVISLAYELFHL
jgi:hypothetical protein